MTVENTAAEKPTSMLWVVAYVPIVAELLANKLHTYCRRFEAVVRYPSQICGVFLSGSGLYNEVWEEG